MIEETIFEMQSPYRETLCLKGFRFGQGKKTLCIMGALRGNEIQQLYICGRLIRTLKKLEEEGKLVRGHEILVIPCGNPYSMNIGKRFWAVDHTDINRMFPGYDEGETTQRIAAALFEQVKQYIYGIQFTSFYIEGDYLPHIRVMKTGYEDASLLQDFEMKYAVLRNPKPYDTTTLNYNWQIWNTKAFSILANKTSKIDEESAHEVVHAVLRFLKARGVINRTYQRGYITTLLDEDEIVSVKAKSAGIYRQLKKPGDEVREGEILAHIIDPYQGKIIDQVRASHHGIVFFVHTSSLIMEQTIAYKLIKLNE